MAGFSLSTAQPVSALPSPYFRVAASDLFALDDDGDDDELLEDEETLVYVQIDEDDAESCPDVSWSMVDADELYGDESEITLSGRSIEIDVSELRSPARPPPLPVALPRLAVPDEARRPLPSPPRAPAPPLKKRPLPFKARPVSPWSLESYRGRVIAVKARRRKEVGPPVPPPWLAPPPPVDTPSSSTAPVTLSTSQDEAEERRAARIVSRDEPRGGGQSFVLVLAFGAIGALLYVGAQRYEGTHAAATMPSWSGSAPTEAARHPTETVTATPSSSTAHAPSAMPPASSSVAPRASASTARNVAPPKHVPPPAPPKPVRPASVPVRADRASSDTSMEKALSDAKRETDSTL